MRRFVTLAILLHFTIPFGVSISGCSTKSATVFCNGGDSGVPVNNQITATFSEADNSKALYIARLDAPEGERR